MAKKNVVEFDGTAQLFINGDYVSISLKGEHLSGQPRLSTGVDSAVGKQLVAEIHRSQTQDLIDGLSASGHFRVTRNGPGLWIWPTANKTDDPNSDVYAQLWVESDGKVDLVVGKGMTAPSINRLLTKLFDFYGRIDAWKQYTSDNTLVKDLMISNLTGRRSNNALIVAGTYIQLGSPAIPVITAYSSRVLHSLDQIRDLLLRLPSQRGYPLVLVNEDLASMNPQPGIKTYQDFFERTVFVLGVEDKSERTHLSLHAADGFKLTAHLVQESFGAHVLSSLGTDAQQITQDDVDRLVLAAKGWLQFEEDHPRVLALPAPVAPQKTEEVIEPSIEMALSLMTGGPVYTVSDVDLKMSSEDLTALGQDGVQMLMVSTPTPRTIFSGIELDRLRQVLPEGVEIKTHSTRFQLSDPLIFEESYTLLNSRATSSFIKKMFDQTR